MIRPFLSHLLGEVNLAAELFKSPLQALHHSLFFAFIKIVGAEVLILGFVGEEIIGDGENGVSDGNRRSFLTPTSSQTSVLGLEVGARFSPGGMSGFGEGRAEITITVARATMFAFSGREIFAGAKFGPSGEVLRGRKTTHIPTDFHQEFLGDPVTDARNGGDTKLINTCYR